MTEFDRYFQARMAELRGEDVSRRRNPYDDADASQWRPYELPAWLRARKARQEKADRQRPR